MKVLILTETIAGTGHFKAAQNVAKGIAAIYPDAQIKIDHSLSQVSPALEKITSKLYIGTIQRASKLWGWAYDKDQQWSLLGKQILRKFIAKKLEPYIQQQSPDIVLSTHAFCLGGLAELKRKATKPFRLGVAFTDYCANPFWIHPEVDHYFVGATELKDVLIEDYDVPPNRISVTGIPIDPRYSRRLEREKAKEKLIARNDLPLCLIMGGGLGFVPFVEILRGLAFTKRKLFVCAIAGANKNARRQMERWLAENQSYPHIVKSLDYVSNMDEWMSAADLLIGKPGGLTVAEALASQLPFLIYKPIPGQEERNCHFLLNSQLAMKINTLSDLPRYVDSLLNNEKRTEMFRRRLAEYAKPDAAFQVGKILCGRVE